MYTDAFWLSCVAVFLGRKEWVCTSSWRPIFKNFFFFDAQIAISVILSSILTSTLEQIYCYLKQKYDSCFAQAIGRVVHICGCIRITLCFSNFFDVGNENVGNCKGQNLYLYLSLLAFQDTSSNAMDPCYLSLRLPTDAVETFLTVHIFHFLAFRF